MSWFTLLAFATHTLRHFVGLLVSDDRVVSIPHIIAVVIACFIIIIGSILYLVRMAVRQMKTKE